jgi:hypothetical protein
MVKRVPLSSNVVGGVVYEVVVAPVISATESMFGGGISGQPFEADISVTQIVRQKTMTFGYEESDRAREA